MAWPSQFPLHLDGNLHIKWAMKQLFVHNWVDVCLFSLHCSIYLARFLILSPAQMSSEPAG